MNSNILPSWMRPMRRQDRAIVDSELIWEILRGAEVCRVAFCGEQWPYIVPMNLGILEEKLYFHCAAAGTKLDLLKVNPNVCFEVEANMRIVASDQACDWSVQYQSVIGFGRVSVVEDLDEKRAGIGALLSQLSDREIDVPQIIPPDTVILRVDVLCLTGKQSPAE